MRSAFLIAAVLMFLAGRTYASRDYVVYGTLRVASENADTLQCAISLEHASYWERRKFVLVTKPDSALATFCHTHANERVMVSIRTAHVESQDAEVGVGR
jgi:hypothetical protein